MEDLRVKSSIISTVNNVIFSYDLWCLDILSDNARRIKSEDFDNLLTSIVEKLEHSLITPYTVRVDSMNRISLMPKEGGMFMPQDIKNNFMYFKPSILFADELRFLIKHYKNLSYATIPSSVNLNAESIITDENNYFFIMKDNLIDDERILRNIFGNNIRAFNNTKEGLIKYLDKFCSGDLGVEVFLISDYFWIDVLLYELIIESGMENDYRVAKMVNTGKSILYTPENKKLYDDFKKAYLAEEGKLPVASFSLSKLWDRK